MVADTKSDYNFFNIKCGRISSTMFSRARGQIWSFLGGGDYFVRLEAP